MAGLHPALFRWAEVNRSPLEIVFLAMVLVWNAAAVVAIALGVPVP